MAETLNTKTVVLSFALTVASGTACQTTGVGGDSPLALPGFLAVRVEDVGTAATWYGRVFDLDEVNRVDSPDGRFKIRVLSSGNLTVELIEERGVVRSADRHVGHFKFGIYVPDIASFHRRLTELGVDVDADIFYDEALGARSFVFRDNEGNRLQAFQRCGGEC